MAKLNISQLDFDNIKSNLKRFLSNQNQFKDYDFEGSGMAVLMDLLAYNTHYLSYNANIAANEMFIDTADLRNSIVSLAKALGYTPNSVTAPYADVTLVVNDATGATVTMSAPEAVTAFAVSSKFLYFNSLNLNLLIELQL